MDETYDNWFDDECFDIRDDDDDDHADADTDDDADNDTNDHIDDDTDDDGRGNRRPLPDLVLARTNILEEIWSWE